MINLQNSESIEAHILVVDDESSVRELLQEFLSLEGYGVDTAADGNDALDHLGKSSYDIILTDLEMPGMNGLDLLKKADALGQSHKFIMLTGYGTVETAIMALKLGAIDYILKPFKLEELGLIIRNAIHRRKLEEENIRLKEALSLYQISEAMVMNSNVRSVIELILEKAMIELDADIIMLSLKEPLSSPRVKRMYKSAVGITARDAVRLLDRDKVFGMLREKRYVIVNGGGINAIASDDGPPVDVRSFLSVAVGFSDRFYGAFSAFRVKENMPFTEANRKLAAIFAERLTSLLEVKRSDEGLQLAMIESIESFANALEAKEPYTKGHSDRVSVYAKMLAERMHLDGKSVSDIAQAGRLHDIGKIGMRYDALTKTDGLSKEEYDQFKMHTIVGANILKPMKFLADIIPIILYHHERYDGKGYPEGLKGTEIPIGARVLAVCDSFDVMTSDRPYRKPLSRERVLADLKNNKGTQFDPEVVDAMLLLIEEGEVPIKDMEHWNGVIHA